MGWVGVIFRFAHGTLPHLCSEDMRPAKQRYVTGRVGIRLLLLSTSHGYLESVQLFNDDGMREENTILLPQGALRCLWSADMCPARQR